MITLLIVILLQNISFRIKICTLVPRHKIRALDEILFKQKDGKPEFTIFVLPRTNDNVYAKFEDFITFLYYELRSSFRNVPVAIFSATEDQRYLFF